MEDKLNLIELLKDKVGNNIYSTIEGSVPLKNVRESPVETIVAGEFIYDKHGRLYDHKNGETLLFPSKEQRDWNKYKDPYIDCPTTWEDCIKQIEQNKEKIEYISTSSNIFEETVGSDGNIEVFGNCLPIGYAKPMLAYCKLLLCRSRWIKKWVPDWADNSYKYCIVMNKNTEAIVVTSTIVNYPLSFPTTGMANKFKECYKSLILNAKMFI